MQQQCLVQWNEHVSRMKKKHKKRKSGKGPRSESKVDHVLDLSGMIIPLTLLKITQAFRNIKEGETMDIVGTDPDTRREFLKVLGTSPCKVLRIKNEKDHYFIRLKKEKIWKEA